MSRPSAVLMRSMMVSSIRSSCIANNTRGGYFKAVHARTIGSAHTQHDSVNPPAQQTKSTANQLNWLLQILHTIAHKIAKDFTEGRLCSRMAWSLPHIHTNKHRHKLIKTDITFAIQSDRLTSRHRRNRIKSIISEITEHKQTNLNTPVNQGEGRALGCLRPCCLPLQNHAPTAAKEWKDRA